MGKVLFMRKGNKRTTPVVPLPKGYTKLAYIQSSGTQYVDTGFTPNQDTCIEMDVVPLSVAETGEHTGFIPYGAAVSYNNSAFECYTTAAKVSVNYDGQYNLLGAVSVGDNLHLSHNKNAVSLLRDGSELYSYTFNYAAFTAPYTLVLFGTRRSSMLCGLQKISSCQIYDNGTLVRDFVPCINESGEVGLYDMVGRKFYGNAGTGTFGAGDVVEYSLPEGYTELAYIESTGTQYCDSGIKGNQNTRIEADYSTTATQGAIIGADSAWKSNMCTIEVHFAAFATSSYTYDTVPSGRHTVSLNKGVFSLDGTVLSTMTGTFTTPVNMTLFALNRNGAKQEYGSIKLYSMQIYESDACVRWYVPVITSAGAVGLWDVISRAFFGNDGSGAFVGSEVA